MEDLVHALVEVARAGNERAVYQEEFSFESVRQGAADGRLSGARRPGQQYATLAFESQLVRQILPLQWKDDVRFQAADDIIDSLEI